MAYKTKDELIQAIANRKTEIGYHGKNDSVFEDLYFQSYSCEEDIFPGYKCIILLTYKIEQDDVDMAMDYNIRPRDDYYSDYDCTTGNIHPSMGKIKNIKNHKVRQIVLANNIPGAHIGPKSLLKNDEQPIDEKFFYTPRANYYPLINNEVKLNEYEESKQEKLKEIWNLIPDILKEEIEKK